MLNIYANIINPIFQFAGSFHILTVNIGIFNIPNLQIRIYCTILLIWSDIYIGLLIFPSQLIIQPAKFFHK